ncbi:PIN domain-containing protein [Candidatus Woesearchaeota archaeon]|nr:PIN domain-containing protein [Candidatus Woesearchaeota archaeon]
MSGSNNSLLLDTNIFLDVIGGFDERDAIISKQVLEDVKNGKKIGIIIGPVLTELYYLISRAKNENEAKKYLKMILSLPNVQIIPIGREESIKAGSIYHKYNSGQKHKDWLSIVDCLIIACGCYLESSIVCSWDPRFKQVTETTICKPTDIVS